jgi:transcriptional regulator with XRE-family HTH domain
VHIDASVGEKIKQRREDKKMTQHELAKLLGITPAAVCQWETRGTVPRAKTLAKVAEVLNVSEHTEQGVVTLAEVVERTRKQIAELTGLSSDQLKLTLTMDGLDATAAGNRAVKS